MASEWHWNRPTIRDRGTYEVAVDYDSASASQERRPAEFDRLEDPTRKLTAVPKTELDEKPSKK
jgi:hypothetical protein